MRPLVAVLLVLWASPGNACVPAELLQAAEGERRAELERLDSACRDGLRFLREGRAAAAYPLLQRAAQSQSILEIALDLPIAEASLGAGVDVASALTAWERVHRPEALVASRRRELVERLGHGRAAVLLRDDPGRPSAALLKARAERDSAAPTAGARDVTAGRLAALGQAALRGIRLGLDRRTTLVVRDSAAQAVSDSVVELSDEGVTAILGPIGKSEATKAAESAQRLGVPLVQLSVAGASFIPDTERRVFRAFVSRSAQCAALVARAKAQGARRFAIARVATPYGHALATAFRQAVEDAGFRVVADVEYPAAATQLTRTARTVEAEQFDFLFVAENRLTRAATLLRYLALEDVWSHGASPSGRRIRILGPAEWRRAVASAEEMKYLHGATVAVEWPGPQDEERARFDREVKTVFGMSAGLFEAVGYDAIRIVQKGRARARRSMAENLRSGTFTGVLGRLEFDRSGEPVRRPRLYRMTPKARGGFELLPPKRS